MPPPVDLTQHAPAPILTATLAIWTAAWSAIAFFAMWGDKRRSRQSGRRRTRERTLLRLAWLGGAPGAWLAMGMLRHKTRHVRFRVQVPLASVLWLLSIAAAAWSSTSGAP